MEAFMQKALAKSKINLATLSQPATVVTDVRTDTSRTSKATGTMHSNVKTTGSIQSVIQKTEVEDPTYDEIYQDWANSSP